MSGSKLIVLGPYKILTLIMIILFFKGEYLDHRGNPPLFNISKLVNDQEKKPPYWDWIYEPLQVSGLIRSCDFLSEDDGWAVGENGTILHWDGIEWKTYPNPRPGYFTNLNDIKMSSKNSGWAVGENGYIIHWNGDEWADKSYSTNSDLFALSMVSDDFGFALGGSTPDLGKERLALVWNGERWSRIAFPKPESPDYDPRLRAVQLASRQAGWASGYNELYLWNGKDWEKSSFKTNPSEPFIEINDFFLLNGSDLWAVGYAGFKTSNGVIDGGGILHWDGEKWNDVYRGPYIFTSIKMLSSEMGWAIGFYRTDIKPQNAPDQMIYYWDGVKWSEYEGKNQTRLNTICGFDIKHLWIFGRSGVLRLVEKIQPTLTPTFEPVKTSTEPVRTSTIKPIPTLAITNTPKITTTSNQPINPPVFCSAILVPFAVPIIIKIRRRIRL